MEMRLARKCDAPMIHAMQLRAFMPLYEKYRDAGSPALETVERVLQRIEDPLSRCFIICDAGEAVGAIRVQRLKDRCRISPLFVLPEKQGKGFAQQAMRQAEAMYPDVKLWVLDTILQETGNCHLYEKMGYVRVGEPHPVNERMTLIEYEKQI